MKNIFENIGIIYNETVQDAENTAKMAQAAFLKKEINTKLVTIGDLDDKISLAIVVGGDGTLLRAARFYSNLDVAVFGINIGRLGFLAQVKADEIDFAVDRILKDEYKIEQRLMLSTANGEITALNDIVIKGESYNRTSKLFVYINDKLVCEYLADGLIISTPTGSTAYTLSAGGPVLVPSLDALVIVPICPHTLNVRPLVVPSTESITVRACDNCSGLYVTSDGQNTVEVKQHEKVIVKKHNKTAKLMLLESENGGFYTILREKLHWGVSPKA